MSTMAPICAGHCGKQMDDPPGQEPWLAVIGNRGGEGIRRPGIYFVCPDCEIGAMATLLSNLSDEEVIRLPDNSPGTVFRLIRGEPDEDDD